MLLFLLLAAASSAGPPLESNHSARLLAADGEDQCSVCDFREHSKQMRIHIIKSRILNILRLEQAPNISRDMIRQLLPKAPPLTQLLDQYDPRVEEEDHATTETIITMATMREYAAEPCFPFLLVHLSVVRKYRLCVKTIFQPFRSFGYTIKVSISHKTNTYRYTVFSPQFPFIQTNFSTSYQGMQLFKTV